jgi:hypothetical protein
MTAQPVPTSAAQSTSIIAFQPAANFIFPRRLFGKNQKARSAHHAWFASYPWLSYEIKNDSLICSICENAFKKNLFMPGSRLDMHFINIGFTNWKKATQSQPLTSQCK